MKKTQRTNEVRIMGGWAKNSILRFPDVPDLRPTSARVRETVFNWLGQSLDGKMGVDLFAGSGAMGFEAASRGAKMLVIEKHPLAYQALLANQARLGFESVSLAKGDAILCLANLADGSVDFILADPPFKLDLWSQLLPMAYAKMKPYGFLYLEAATLPTLPPTTLWRCHRTAKAGAVHYALWQKIA
jgi:16S rRNA (guanine966-N2)-methyltransferase